MASLRTRQRKDGTVYTSVLYVHQGKQTSSSFNNHAEALQFQDVCNRLGPAEALRIWEAVMPGDGHTVASFIDGHLDVLSGVEKKTIAEYRRYVCRDIEPTLGHIPLSTLSRTDISRWVNKMRENGSSWQDHREQTRVPVRLPELRRQGGADARQPGCRCQAAPHRRRAR